MYSKEFIAEVKAVYPDSPDMIRMAEEGIRFLGRYLDDSQSGGFPVDKILLATSLDDLQREARLAKRKTKLYSMWSDENSRIINAQK